MRPATGWSHTAVPDRWLARWPGFSGTVWYRMDLSPACQGNDDVTLFIERMNMAGAVWVNDTLLWRDVQLTEPLSRSWNMPRYWHIPRTMLHLQHNTLWIQIIGLAFHEPELGRVRVGNGAQIDDIYKRSVWSNRHMLTINLVVSGVIGVICLLIWSLRRREKAFGWYGLSNILWVIFGYNALATSAWPFANSLQVTVFNNIAFVLYTTSFCLFTWRFGQCQYPKIEKALWKMAAAAILLLLFAPVAMKPAVAAVSGTVYVLTFLLVCIAFQFHAWKVRRMEDILLAVTLLVFLGIALHSVLFTLQVIESDALYLALSGLAGMVYISLMLAWIFVRNIKKIEMAAEELKITVEETSTQLRNTLEREHTLELQNVRLKERLQIARDLHDGFGSSLVRSITLVEHTQEALERKHYLSILKSVRDDLRQVIDNSANAVQQVSDTPAQWIAPIRHRFTRIFEELSIRSSWTVPERWSQRWTHSHLMDLTRFVEEGLTNVIKHSQATRVDVVLEIGNNDSVETLSVVVRDNGTGFDVSRLNDPAVGFGTHSMRARIERLGGTLDISASPSGTVLRALFHYPVSLPSTV